MLCALRPRAAGLERRHLHRPQSDPATWAPGTQLDIIRQPLGGQPLPAARRFADGLSSWLLRRTDGTAEWLVFDRPAGSERDLVVLAGVLGANVVQRHPSGAVRVVGAFGVLRWEGLRWQHEPPVASWVDSVMRGEGDGRAQSDGGDARVRCAPSVR